MKSIGPRDVWFGGERTGAAVYDRGGLTPGARVSGPAIVVQMDSTTAVPPGWGVLVDSNGNLVLERLDG